VKEMTLLRFVTGNAGTFGALMFQNIPFAVTLERQRLNNQSRISCIPAGNYACRRVNSPKFGDTFEVTHVTNRSHILFHKGNLDDDSYGCILVAEEFGKLGNESGVKNSAAGYGEFMAILAGDDTFNLTIKDCFQ
jgi:hypothetical protein